MKIAAQKWFFPLGIVLGSLFLAGCSLAEDITPPPGYQYVTPAVTVTLASATPVPASTQTAQGALNIPTQETTQAASTSAASTAHPADNGSVAVFSGKVTNGTGSAIPAGLTANLYLYNTSTSTVQQSLTAAIGTDGAYRFDQVPADKQITYFAMVDYQGVTYASEPVTYDGTSSSFNVPLTVYDATSTMDSLSLSQVHMQFDFSTSGQAQARILYIVSNLGTRSVTIQSDGSTIPFIQIPKGSSNVEYQLAQDSAVLANADNGFALLPTSDKQYAILATFSLPYTGSLDLVQPFVLPVSSETIMVPLGIKVNSDQLTDAGTQSFQSSNFHLYQGGMLTSGSSLDMSISGKPGGAAGTVGSNQTYLLIGLVLLGLVLIGAGLFLFMRGRGRALAPGTVMADPALADALGDDREALMDAIIALDDQFKTGCISREAYSKRRNELKNRLKLLL